MLICKDQKTFAYQCLDNVTSYKYATFDQNTPYGFRVMSIFTKRLQQSEMKLGIIVRQITGIILVNLDLRYIENVLTDFDSSELLLKETS